MPALNETDKVGLALEERLMHEMQSRGFRIVDYKITGTLKIRPTGDFVYSRNVSELKNEYNIHYFLAGVIESNADGYVIHARLVDATNNLLVSSAQAFLNGRDATRILGDFRPMPVPTRTMMVVGNN
jgi:TolB-like protein